MENQLVVFDLANEHYGVDIGAVDRIIELQAITAVPHAPEFVEGITNLRGMVLPVVDDSSFITGIAKVDERLIILLDLDKVLSPTEQASLKSLQFDEEESPPAEE